MSWPIHSKRKSRWRSAEKEDRFGMLVEFPLIAAEGSGNDMGLMIPRLSAIAPPEKFGDEILQPRQ
jgi:hypothetical protein